MRTPGPLLCLLLIHCAPRAIPPPSGVRSVDQAGRSAPEAVPLPASTPGRLRLAVAGDVTLGFHYEEQFDARVREGATPESMFEYGFREVRPALQDSDLFLVNLECPFTDRGEKIAKNFNFRARPELVNVLLRGGVGVASLANNHAMDYGETGLLDTIATLDKAGIPHFGAGRTLAEARKPRVVERNGVKVAFLGYLFLGPKHIEPAQVFATDTTPGVAGHFSDPDAMDRMVREDVAAARALAPLVIPYFHWGREGTHLPEAYQVRLARAAIDAGAAAVLGSHPHVLQGMELYQGAPVVYSLGNFLFGGNWNPRVKESALFKAQFSADKYQGSEVVPVLVDRYPEFPIQPNVPEGERAQLLLRNLASYSQRFEFPLPALIPFRPKAEGGATGPSRADVIDPQRLATRRPPVNGSRPSAGD